MVKNKNGAAAVADEPQAEQEKNERPSDQYPVAVGDGVTLSTLADMYRFAGYVKQAGVAPSGMNERASIVIALETGAELGLKPVAAIQNVAVINGRPCVWGDAVPGIVRASGLLAGYKQEEVGTPFNDDYGWRVTARRKGDPAEELTHVFTVADAKRAGLWEHEKKEPWQKYPKRMLLMRARTYVLRDLFPDVLKGIYTSEEVRDLEITDYEVVEDDGPTRPCGGNKADRVFDRLRDEEPEAEPEPGPEPEQDTPPAKEPEADSGAGEKEEQPAGGAQGAQGKKASQGRRGGRKKEKEAPAEDEPQRRSAQDVFDDLGAKLEGITTAEEMAEFRRRDLAGSISSLTGEQHKKLVELCKAKDAELKKSA